MATEGPGGAERTSQGHTDLQCDRARPKPLQENRVILAEGADAYFFLIWAYQAFGAEGIEVRDFGGNEELRLYLQALKLDPNFENLRTLVVARDAEADAEAALRSVAGALADAGLPSPDEPFSFTTGAPGQLRAAIMIFPGHDASNDESRLANGTLEDLCLGTIAPSDPTLACLEDYMACVSRLPNAPVHPKKARLHAYLAGKNDYAGLKLGEATRAKAWDLDHESLAPIKETILAM